MNEWKEAALSHAKVEDPKESCGLLLNIKGKERYFPCRNLSKTEHQCFIIATEDYVKADNLGDKNTLEIKKEYKKLNKKYTNIWFF